MQQLFQFKCSTDVNRSTRNPYNLQHHRLNQVTFGSNSLRSLGSQVWNSLFNATKSAEPLKFFSNDETMEWHTMHIQCMPIEYVCEDSDGMDVVCLILKG